MARWRWTVALLGLLACGGRPPAVAQPAPDLDADPFALLPGSAVILAEVDAESLRKRPKLGPPAVALAERYLPLGPEAGFDPQRDVDRIVVASYQLEGSEVAAVLSGHFDEAKIAAATKTRSGKPIAHGTHAGRATYSVEKQTYAVLTARTAIAGSAVAVDRVLDRIASGKLEVAVPPWMLTAVKVPGASLAAVLDAAMRPLSAPTIGGMKLTWIEGVRTAVVVAHAQDPGLVVHAKLTYPTPPQASSAADAIRGEAGMLKLVGPLLGGISIQGLDVSTHGPDLEGHMTLDDATLEKLLGMAPRFLPAP
jgi:hypothetical protein